MKRLLIFEGIASSGKTILERKLQEALAAAGDVGHLSEGSTLMPLIDNRDPVVAQRHLMEVVRELTERSEPTIIVDRFHLTHAFRTSGRLDDFRDVERALADRFQTEVVLLRFDDEKIRQRIVRTVTQRGGSWQKGKKGTPEEQAEYYRAQQEALAELVRGSTLPHLVIDTTAEDWEGATHEILRELRRQGWDISERERGSRR